jgi:hypothetical protein
VTAAAPKFNNDRRGKPRELSTVVPFEAFSLSGSREMRNLNSVHLNSVQPSAISSLLIYPAGLLEKFKTYYRSLFGLTRPLGVA